MHLSMSPAPHLSHNLSNRHKPCPTIAQRPQDAAKGRARVRELETQLQEVRSIYARRLRSLEAKLLAQAGAGRRTGAGGAPAAADGALDAPSPVPRGPAARDDGRDGLGNPRGGRLRPAGASGKAGASRDKERQLREREVELQAARARIARLERQVGCAGSPRLEPSWV
jgi:hypothetical protein